MWRQVWISPDAAHHRQLDLRVWPGGRQNEYGTCLVHIEARGPNDRQCFTLWRCDIYEDCRTFAELRTDYFSCELTIIGKGPTLPCVVLVELQAYPTGSRSCTSLIPRIHVPGARMTTVINGYCLCTMLMFKEIQINQSINRSPGPLQSGLCGSSKAYVCSTTLVST